MELGIGFFSTYACAFGGKIIPVEVELRWPPDISLSYDPDSGRILRVWHAIDWTVEAFDLAKFRWLNDEFIDPSELKAV